MKKILKQLLGGNDKLTKEQIDKIISNEHKLELIDLKIKHSIEIFAKIYNGNNSTREITMMDAVKLTKKIFKEIG